MKRIGAVALLVAAVVLMGQTIGEHRYGYDGDLYMQKPYFSKFVRLGSLSADSTQMISNYSSPDTFKITAGADTTMYISTMIVMIQDANAGFDSDAYGSIAGGLTNGLLIEYTQGDDTYDLLDGEPVHTNGEWGGFCYDIKFIDPGNGSDYALVHWEFATLRANTHLKLKDGDEFRVIVNDDLTGLEAHTVVLQGHYGKGSY